ncbi:unnamed protein product [Pieris macdunnoughi]|uniref:Uncharacterized protein n=1 Tax=Pieris macdunnoughi TaxID=345717 RepID=A0A821PXH1_9NEOP|nr:unnamed protein product [Pieris macdunnoughi]
MTYFKTSEAIESVMNVKNVNQNCIYVHVRVASSNKSSACVYLNEEINSLLALEKNILREDKLAMGNSSNSGQTIGELARAKISANRVDGECARLAFSCGLRGTRVVAAGGAVGCRPSASSRLARPEQPESAQRDADNFF